MIEMTRSEMLGVGWDGAKRTAAPNRSGLYWDVFVQWWDRSPLCGDGLLVGEEYPQASQLKHFFSHRYSGIVNLTCASLSNSDLDWDITRRWRGGCFDFIICQAVIEHVVDPVAAVANLTHSLKSSGSLFIHSHGPAFKEHRHPIDCYRFLRDGVWALAQLSRSEMVDLLWTPPHWFLWLKKG